MKRIALAVAVVVMAGACKKAQNSNTGAESTRPDSMKMAADSMKMAPADTTHHMAADTAKAHVTPAPPPARTPPPAPARRPTRRP
ncbi:MAG: hypothetical protein DMD38_06895 [Gemmatimonadetes bacterium]|nr:MAG: hypothetical protein AUI86_00305 [Gemmatimonadetes bacterium 13_1_40CM_3_66_12]OLD86825.1 MAG: hypothetical protein AUG85_09415 [Gemmatimonadetes bacterium 13_1_20CM_4_66_11]PYP96863.1 MAG: hypothetical protein DMD38_06895 [Gemmatimonadota bacterium]